MKFAYVLLSMLAVANAAPLVDNSVGGGNALVARSDAVANEVRAVPALPLDNVNNLLQNALGNVKGLTGDLITDVQKLVDGLLTGGLPDLGALLNILAQPASVKAEILKVLQTVLPQVNDLPLVPQVLQLLDTLLGNGGLGGLLTKASNREIRSTNDATSRVEGQLRQALGPLNLPTDVLTKVIGIVLNLLRQLLGGLGGGGLTTGNFGSRLTRDLSGAGLPIDATVITSIVGIVVGILGSLITGLLGGLLGGLGNSVGGILGGLLGGLGGAGAGGLLGGLVPS